MHIPDGFLDAETALAAGALALAGTAVALRQARRELSPRRVPLLGLAASFVFAAQMINFPVAGGTSGHLMGSVLTAVLLGPSAAVIVLTAVLIVQCLVFADGGLSALGANIFNMAILGGVAGWAIYRGISRVWGGLFGRVLAAAFAGWCSTVLAAVACAGELAASGTARLTVVLPTMAGVHMLVGAGEGLITALVLTGIARVRPELLEPDAATDPRLAAGPILVYGVLVALGLALFASPLASRWPDGLEWTAHRLGFADAEAPRSLPAPLADYEAPGIHWSILATSVAGAVGTVAAFALAWLLALALARQAPPGGHSARPGTRDP
jgi:cobalt/nickel transport system permease protein